MSQRFEGRNLEEALTNASQSLGVERWQLTYHVLLEKRGFLGGVKRIVIEADVNREAPPPPAPAALPDYPREPRRGRSDGTGRRERGEGRNRSEGRGSRDGRRPREGSRRRDREEPRIKREPFSGPVPEQGEETDAARTVRGWCEDVIGLANLDLVARSEESDSAITVRLFGSDAGLLKDKHGELLDAIQVLANKALVGRKVEKEIELDCEEFKSHRVDELGQRAREVADRVRQGGREELLPSMTPIERRIVHLALREDRDVTTESRGDGFYKRVAIIPRPAEDAATGEAPQES